MKSSVESKVKEVAEKGWPQWGFVLEDWAGVDRAIDHAVLPCVVCFLVESGVLEFKNGICKDAENVVLAFIDRVEKDADGNDNLTVYSGMKENAKRFVAALGRCGYFDPIEQQVTYNTLYESLAANVSGVWISLTLKERVGVCL